MTEKTPTVQDVLECLYGLLDEPDAERIRAWMMTPAGAAARADAERMRQLLADAAKREFPGVRFEPPSASIAAPQRRRWPSWLVAAAGVAAAIGPMIWQGIEVVRADRSAEAAHARFVAARQPLAEREQQQMAAQIARSEAETRLAEQQAAYEAALADAADRLRQQEMSVVISGPANVLPGAPNVFEIQTVDGQRQPVPAGISVRVRDQSDRVVYEQSMPQTWGAVAVQLPLDLPLTPKSDLFLDVSARRADGRRSELRAQLPLALPDWVTHLTTDKPLYQPGEAVYFRSLTLERFSLRPPREEFELQYLIVDPRGVETPIVSGGDRLIHGGAIVRGPDGQPLRGVGAGEWTIPIDSPGGEFTLVVREAKQRFREVRRRILVNQYQAARLEKVLEWSRRSYGPGDVAVAHVRVSRAEGGPAARQPVQASAVVDGTAIAVDPPGLTDDLGRVAIRLTLPPAMERGEASLNVTVTDGANVESLVKPIPIALNKLMIEFFPEGGDLIAGAANRVYFQVRTTLGRPADLKGRVVDAAGREVARAETFTDDSEPGINQGLGRFEFTPEAGQTYRLVVEQPLGIQGEHVLPAAKADGVVLRSFNSGGADVEHLRVRVHSAGARRALMVGAYARGRLLDHQRVTVEANQAAEIDLRLPEDVGGVTRITVFEEQPGAGEQRELRPVAERLVYRRPAGHLRFAVRPEHPQYAPGENVQLHVAAVNERGEPTPAVVYLGVVNQSVVTMADEKTARSLPTHFLLTSEVRNGEDLEHTDVLLGDHPKAAEALDLLLGTQGWRRFAEQPGGAQPPAGDGVLLAQAPAADPRRTLTSLDLERRKLDEEFQPRLAEARLAFDEAQRRWNQALAPVDGGQAAAAAAAEREWTEAAARRDSAMHSWRRIAHWSVPLLCLLAVLAAGISLVRRGWRPLTGLVAVGATLAGVAALLLSMPMNARAPMNRADFEVAGAALPAPKSAMEPKDNDLGGRVRLETRAPAQPAGKDALPKTEHAFLGAPPAAPAGRAVPAPMLKKAGSAGEARSRSASPKPAGERLGRGLAPAFDKAPNVARSLQRDRAAVAADALAPVIGGGIGGDAMIARPPTPGYVPPLVVRQYSHQHSPTPNAERSDFAETVFWHPALVLSTAGATVGFDLSDSVTRYRVLVAGHSLDGRLGSLTTHIEARKPLTVEPKAPIEISAGDQVDLPVTIANDSNSPREVTFHFEATGLTAHGVDAGRIALAPHERIRRIVPLRPNGTAGTGELRISVAGGGASDTVVLPLPVVAEGFPISGAVSDVLSGAAQQEITLPETWMPGSLQCQVTAFPSTLSELQRGLEGLLQEPGGCFEQTSTTNYPNTMILSYLQESGQSDPGLVQRAQGLLRRGYSKLTAFEVPAAGRREGFEWFGQSPPHEALTAYGLMQFRDMARVSDVEPALLERTRAFLMSRRDGRGGFLRNPRALDTFGRAPADVTNAYIVWALTESGTDDVTRELDSLADQARNSRDAYFLALVANALLNRNRAEEALDHLRSLAAALSQDGYLDRAAISITGSTGRMLQIETTALAVLGWLKANRPAEFAAPLRAAVNWIGRQRGGSGSFGSTQSTILALKALIAYTQANKRSVQAGDLKLFVGDREAGRLAFPAAATGELTIALPEPDQLLRAGKNNVRVELSGQNALPYTVAWSYRSVQPPNAEECAVRLETRLAQAELAEGDATQLLLKLRNVSGQGQGMTVAIVGLPAGLKLPDDFKQLRDLAQLRPDGRPGTIAAFEIRGRELVLYWRDLAPDADIDLAIDLRAHVPGAYTGPASRAYIYYNPDAKHWTPPLRARIAAK